MTATVQFMKDKNPGYEENNMSHDGDVMMLSRTPRHPGYSGKNSPHPPLSEKTRLSDHGASMIDCPSCRRSKLYQVHTEESQREDLFTLKIKSDVVSISLAAIIFHSVAFRRFRVPFSFLLGDLFAGAAAIHRPFN